VSEYLLFGNHYTASLASELPFLAQFSFNAAATKFVTAFARGIDFECFLPIWVS
jgi:hypothetical protein